MTFDIHSLEGAGELTFGMSRDEVRKALDVSHKEFKRNEEDSSLSDSFEELGVFAYYDMNDSLEAIEFATPASVMYSGVNLLEVPFDELTNVLKEKDENLEVKSDTITSNALGIGAWTPSTKEDPAALPESIIVFKKGYYKAD